MPTLAAAFMKRKQRSPQSTRTPGGRPSSRRRRPAILIVVGLVALTAAAALVLRRGHGPAGATRIASRPTYHRDIAPIIYTQCAPCHHPGQAAPFDLLTFRDVQKRARQIREVVERRIMPPWLPDPTNGPFVGQRSLSANQIAVIQRWVEQGAVEGSPSDAPAVPRWNDNWQLGTPDLVIQMPEPFRVPAGGADVYRIFVIPIPTTTKRYVRGIELQPGNPRVVHHAFMHIDPTPESRRRDALEPGVGFSGLHTPTTAQMPAGQSLSWQPGKRHLFAPPGLAWTLQTNCDLVLQTHLRPSGKPETLQSSIAFYFTDEAPTNTPFKIGICSFDIDIPAGTSQHPIHDTYTLAADVELLSILPHAHYLGKDLRAFATPPGGAQQELLHIANWDFSWQGDYRFEKPVFLPKGTMVEMFYVYDNSTNNVRNPHDPPQRVRYGLRSDDEMAELWLQVLPVRTNDVAALARYDQPRVFRDSIAYNQYLLRLNPNDARAHGDLGKAKLFLGQADEAEPLLRRAAALDASLDEPHYFLGLLFRMRNQPAEAIEEFAAAIQRNPGNAKAHGNLGLVLFYQGQTSRAATHLREALRLNPEDEIARETLNDIAKGTTRKAGGNGSGSPK